MLRNYLTTAVRALRRQPGYAALSITGLAVGLACCLLIGLWIADEVSYDRYHDRAGDIYRLVTAFDSPDYDGIAKVTGPWGPTAEAEIQAVEDVVRFVFYGEALVERGDTRAYVGGGRFADAAIFDVFDYPGFRGDPQAALSRPDQVVLTQSMARQFFGDADPIGRTLTFDGEADYTVSGVLDDVPANSHFTFSFLISMPTLQHPDKDDWVRWNQFYTYLLLDPNADPAAVEDALGDMIARYVPAEQATQYGPSLQPLTRIHLHSNLFREMEANGDIRYVYLFGAVGLFILLLACINFMNLATARSALRAREVGVRKALGAHRRHLIQQFLGEATLLTACGLVAALALTSLFLPAFNQLTGKTLTMSVLASPPLLLALAGTVLAVGLLAGSYPAFALSSYRPVLVLTGSASPAGRVGLRRALVVVQFSISIFLVVAALAVQDQLQFIQDKKLGYNEEQLIVLPIRTDDLRQQTETFKQAILQHPGVRAVSASANLPGGTDYGIPTQPEGFTDETRPPLRILAVDPDFVDTYQMEVVAGRDFAADRVADRTGAVLLNEAAVRALGWQDDPLGKTIAMEAVGIGPMPVVGVVQDFHFRSMRERIAPLLLFVPEDGWKTYLTVRLAPDRVPEALAQIETTWASFVPSHPFTYQFLDDTLGRQYAAEARIRTLLGYATALALGIAALGLFGLASFTAQRRTKEIGIRKTLGATTRQITALLTRDFAGPVLLALLVATPLAYGAVHRWLDGFAYRTDVTASLFLIAGALALGVALLSVTTQAIRAARRNPVDALRYE